MEEEASDRLDGNDTEVRSDTSVRWLQGKTLWQFTVLQGGNQEEGVPFLTQMYLAVSLHRQR